MSLNSLRLTWIWLLRLALAAVIAFSSAIFNCVCRNGLTVILHILLLVMMNGVVIVFMSVCMSACVRVCVCVCL
jgi:hypothetical protein